VRASDLSELASAGAASGIVGNTVVSSTCDASGRAVVLSRYGDDQWDLWPYFEQSNLSPAFKRIDWSRVPVKWRGEFKSVAYRYWTEGVPGFNRPVARSVVQLVGHLRGFGKYLDTIGVDALGELHPIHLSGFVHHRKTVDQIKASSLTRDLMAIEMLYRFRTAAGLPFEPWPGSSAVSEAGWTDGGRVHGTTPLIPQDVLQTLFVHAERLLSDADRLLDERDRGDRRLGFDAQLSLLRDACFFLLGVLTGMRCEELVGIEAGAGRTDPRGDAMLYWVRSTEHKTKKGRVEYLMPEMGLRVLEVMERWSKPWRDHLRSVIPQYRSSPDDLSRLAEALIDANRLFLGRSGKSGHVRALSGAACIDRMQRFAEHAGVDWKLRPHQLRRAYAWTFARHRLGNLLFLKEQFKHSSLSMTQLYASNPMQDDALYEDLFSEIATQKVQLVERWLNTDQPLAGRAGERIAKLRAHDFPDREAMLRETAEVVSIRSTGHSWCLAQDEGCGGAGLYEPTRCAGCSDAVIDASQRAVWEELHSHQTELLAEAAALGPATTQRVMRDLVKTQAVLVKLGWTNPRRDSGEKP
jgi:site-specific recombinase XerD